MPYPQVRLPTKGDKPGVAHGSDMEPTRRVGLISSSEEGGRVLSVLPVSLHSLTLSLTSSLQ